MVILVWQLYFYFRSSFSHTKTDDDFVDDDDGVFLYSSSHFRFFLLLRSFYFFCTYLLFYEYKGTSELQIERIKFLFLRAFSKSSYCNRLFLLILFNFFFVLFRCFTKTFPEWCSFLTTRATIITTYIIQS